MKTLFSLMCSVKNLCQVFVIIILYLLTVLLCLTMLVHDITVHISGLNKQ